MDSKPAPEAPTYAQLKEAATQAFDAEDMVAALQLWTKVADEATREGSQVPLKEQVDALTSVARVYASSVHHVPQFVAAFDRAIQLAEADTPLVVATLVLLGRTLYRAGQPDHALQQFQNALALATNLKDADGHHHGCYYVPALLEFGRITAQMNVEQASEKASRALHEAVEGAARVYGPLSEPYCLALAGLGEAKKAAGDNQGAVEDMERALAPNVLGPLDQARVLTHLGTAYSELERADAAQRTLECFTQAVQVRSRCFSNGARHFMVAEIQLDIAAEHWQAQRFTDALAALEAAVPYLHLPDKAMDVQWAWLRKCYEQAGLSQDEAAERYRAIKTTRKQVEAARRRLPAPKKDPAASKGSFLPPDPVPSGKKKGGKGKSKK